MRKSAATRILGLIALYFAVFVILVMIQFSKKGNISLPVGAMLIRGQQRISTEEQADPQTRFLSGGAGIFFGGLEFSLREGSGLYMMGTDGVHQPVNPESLIVSDESAYFSLPGGTTLVFTSMNTGGNPELRISAEFGSDITSLNIPFRPRRSTLVHSEGQFGFLSGGTQYMFSRYSQELETGNLILSAEYAFASYRARPQQQEFNPADYVISQAMNSGSYNGVLNQWLDRSYRYWEQNISFFIDEDTAAAFCSEALRRGSYTEALALLPREFPASTRPGYESSVFTGGTARAYRSLNDAEREKSGRVSRLINQASLDFLEEEHVLDFLLVRGLSSMANNALEVIRSIDEAELMLKHCPGLLEVYMDFRQWRLPSENPVGDLTERICVLISENIQRDAVNDLVYVANNGGEDTEFNLRLGTALVFWAEGAGNDEWAAIGRSLVLSSLAQGEASGYAKLYRILKPGDHYPRAAQLVNGLWAWTASPSVSAAFQESDILRISVSFPAGVSHYMIIRGLRPFISIRLHDIGWRSDPQFERYDSSGWIYYPQDQTLILKMRHRTTIENIIISYRVEVEPEVVSEDEANGDAETEDRAFAF
ncbi:MAG: hypothetical protein FWG99_11230 [Treponema sp.]|nr:hypothetical protein [Treponema sp.]